jgi:hypothetical protein
MFEKNDLVGIGDGDSFRTGRVLKVAKDGEVLVAWDDAAEYEHPMYYPAQALRLVEFDEVDETVVGFKLLSTEGGPDA